MDMMTAFCWNPITWIMDVIVGPLVDILVDAMLPVLQWGIEFLGDLLMTALADIFFDIFVILLSVVNFFTSAFFVFAGVSNITLRSGTGGFQQSNTFVLQYLMENMGMTRIYWIMTMLSAALCLIFTGISILRSINNTEFDPKQTVGKIWGRLGKTMLTFLVIPVIMLFGIELSTMVAGALVNTGSAPVSVDNMIFLSSTMEAAKNGPNGSGASFTDGVRNKYFTGQVSYQAYDSGESSFSKSDRLCANDFDLAKIDYLTGYIVCGFMIFIMLGASLMAVRRLLEILLLYITAPLFVASIPLDEGKKFEGWRDMFVAKLVSCYGLILMMTLYLSFVPTMMGSSLRLATNGFQDSLMKVFLLLGGAFALKNSHSLLLGIISPAAAQSAQGSVLAGVAMGMGATRMIKGKIGSMGRSGGAKGGRPAPTNNSSAPSVQHQNAADAQKYSG